MTEQQTEPAPAEEPQGAHEVSTPDEPVENAPEAPEDEPEGGKGNREAARYRTQLRDAQAQLEQTGGRLAAMQRAEVVRLAGESLARGTDLLLHRGEDIGEYLAEDGTVDAEKVQAAVRELVQERSYLTGKRFQGTADQGVMPRAKPAPTRMGAIFDRPAS